MIRPAPTPVREVIAVGPEGVRRKGMIMQYYHLVTGDMFDPQDRYVPSDCLRLRMDGLPDAEQSRYDEKTFEIQGHEFVLQD